MTLRNRYHAFSVPFMSQGNFPVAVVTGASRGVGAAIAAHLAKLQFHVCLCSRNLEALTEICNRIMEIGGSASAHSCDISIPEQVDAFAREVLGAHSRCDVLVNNAGSGDTQTPIHELSVKSWDAMLHVNLRGPFLMLRAFAPAMIAAGSGHVINIGSLAGKNPLPNGAAYAASKWGLLGLMLSAAEELRPHGVRVSVVSPGSIATGFAHHRDLPTDDSWKIAPEDIAEVVGNLVTQSDRSFISEVLMRPRRRRPG